MSHLQRLQYNEMMAQMREQAADRDIGAAVFKDWRNRYVSHLAAYIRLYHQAQAAKGAGIASGTILAEINWQPHGWCEAAYHIMTAGDPDLQQQFLLASKEDKDTLAAAVLKDRGIWGFDGTFREIPPC